MSFAKLKTNRDQISKLIQAAETAGGSGEKKSYGDDRLWKPTVDKAGNGYAVLRFLPATEGSELPWVRYWDHGFKGPTGQWYIEKSLTSIGGQDPVGELNSKLWNSGNDKDKETARNQKRRLHYVVNAYIVSDPSNPSHEGKVMLYQFGKKIFDKIMDQMQPQFADEEAVNPFDMWEGSDFKLKIRQVEGYRNYDKSEFAGQKPLSESDETLEKIYDKMFDLTEFTDAKNYKTYEELQTKLNSVLLLNTPSTSTAAYVALDEPAEPALAMAAPVTAEQISETEDPDDTMSYFAKLAADE